MTDTISRKDFRLRHRLRVRWAEVDAQRIVFNPHYLMYIDIAFTDYWRALAVSYESIPLLLGGDLYVKKSTLEYHGSARLDELLDVGVRCERIGTSSLRFIAGVFRGEELLVSGELVYVFADPAIQRPTPVPPALRSLIETYEAGLAVTRTLVGTWDQYGEDARALRRAVFVEELGVPASIEQDAADLSAVHAILRSGIGQAIGTGRLTAESGTVGRIGRVAVARSMRTAGHGEKILRALIAEGIARGYTQLVLGAAQHAQDFYGRLGFVATGAPFMEAGVAHVEMVRPSAP